MLVALMYTSNQNVAKSISECCNFQRNTERNNAFFIFEHPKDICCCRGRDFMIWFELSQLNILKKARLQCNVIFCFLINSGHFPGNRKSVRSDQKSAESKKQHFRQSLPFHRVEFILSCVYWRTVSGSGLRSRWAPPMLLLISHQAPLPFPHSSSTWPAQPDLASWIRAAHLTVND